MAKIELDKYYTSDELAQYCVDRVEYIIGIDNITEYIEPSAGSGVFLKYLNKPYIAYDIEPEHELIHKQDYLELDLEYKKGRCVIGNPPFGKNTTSVQFFKKSIQISDYIAFILPISQMNNNYHLYEFDMIYSEDLGKLSYSDRDVHCCFNIYKRPSNNKLNKKPVYDLEAVEIREYRRDSLSSHEKTKKENFSYDIRICVFGAVGKEVEFEGQYVKESCIKIHNENLKQKVLFLLRNAKWKDICKMTTTPSLPKWRIYKYIKDNIKDIK